MTIELINVAGYFTKPIKVMTFVFVLSAMALAAQAAEETQSDPSLLTVKRIFGDEEFESESFGPAVWLEDSGGYTTIEESLLCPDANEIVLYSLPSGRTEILVPADKLIPPGQEKPLVIDDYTWSKDGKKLLIFTNTKRVWRSNTRGDYWLYDVKAQSLKKIGADADESMLMFAKLSPDGRLAGYVYKKNIYVQDLKNFHTKKLTRRRTDTIINGTSDWVYEEEFGLRDCFEFSDDSKFIAYWQFDTEGVEDFYLINYTDNLYPEITAFKYPKVGQKNSAVRVGVVNVNGGPTAWVDLGDDTRNNYVPRMEWIPKTNRLLIQRMNRLQNANDVIVVGIEKGWLGEARLGPIRTLFTERDDAWVDVHDDIHWIEEGRFFTWTSDRDGYRHIYLISTRGGQDRLLTPGKFDVINVIGADEDNTWVYYIASPDSAAQRYLYRSPIDGSGTVERVTPADSPGTHSYQISKDCKWAIHRHSAFGKPTTIDLLSLPDHKTFRSLEENTELKKKVSDLKKCPTEFFKIDIGDGIELEGWCIKPHDFDPSKKYPLFIYVYGEPYGQTVTDQWGSNTQLWHTMLAQQGYIVASIDNRGTSAPRGRDFRKCVYRQIGILASTEQSAALRTILEQWSFVDSERIGVWGWSGGGSMTLNLMFRYPDLYHTGMALAFISNQRFYDTIYQERYMALPDDNEEGFEQGSPITFAHQLEGNLLIVYGTGDDNCHYQNFQVLVNKLIEHNKHFSMMSYPNRTHAIKEGENTRRHLFELLTKYLNDNLPPGPKP
jgi:dipeptidyl-peptidase-4